MIRINKPIYILSAILCFLSSCNDEETLLSVANSQLEFAREGGIQTITVESNDDWSLYGLPTWLEASRISGINSQQITLTAQRNLTGLDREQTLTVRSNNSKRMQTIKVKQYANAAGQVFTVDKTSVKYFNGTTSEREDSIVLESSVRWKITGPSWLAMNFKGEPSRMTGEMRDGSGTIYLRCCEDYSGEETRKDVITLQTEYGDETIQIPVEQMGIYDVKCVDMHILSDGFWCSYKSGKYTQYIMRKIYKGIVNPEEKAEEQWSYNGKEHTDSYYNLTPDTYYTLMMRAMPSESQYYTKTNAEVIRTATEENQPRAEICDVMQTDDGDWKYSIKMNEHAKGYYLTIFSNTNSSKTSYAWNLYNLIGTKYVGYYEEDGTGNRYGDGTIIAWAVGKDGTLSNVVDMYKCISSSSSFAPAWRVQPFKEHPESEIADKTKMEKPVLTTKKTKRL